MLELLIHYFMLHNLIRRISEFYAFDLSPVLCNLFLHTSCGKFISISVYIRIRGETHVVMIAAQLIFSHQVIESSATLAIVMLNSIYINQFLISFVG